MKWWGGSRAGNQAGLPHHWPVDIPKGPFLTIQDFPLCLILFPVNPERVKRGHEKTLYCFLFCHLSSPAPGAKAEPKIIVPCVAPQKLHTWQELVLAWITGYHL